MIWIIIIVVLIVFLIILSKCKFFKLGCVTMITGAPKTGKSTLALNRALKEYKKALFKWRFKKFILRKDIEKPRLYSNIPLTCEYIPITREFILRQERPYLNSVAYVGEASLVADSMTYDDKILNECMQLLVKLFGHSCNGKLIFDTQAMGDNHFALKRVLDKHLYIYKSITWIPFIIVMKVREMAYSDNNQSAMNVFNEDIEESMKTLIISKSIWKKFDYRCYSVFTDDKPTSDNILNSDKHRYLKQPDPVSFRKFRTLNIEKKESEKNETEKN